MFRVNPSDIRSSLRSTACAFMALLVLAFGASVWGALARGAGLASWLATAASAGAIGAFFLLWVRLSKERASLRRVKLLAHDILASMEQGVITTDTGGLVTSMNGGAMRLLGVGEDCIGRPLRELAAACPPLEQMCADVVDRHASVRDRECQVGHGGDIKLLLTSAHVLMDVDRRTIGAVIHVRDITNRMRLKEQVWRLERLANVSTLARGLHHEIKNPLTALSLHVQLLEERLAELTDQGATGELLGVVKTELFRLNRVLDGFRSFANLERLEPAATDLWDVLDGVIRLMRPQAEAAGVILEVASPRAALPRLMLDRSKIHEAVLNLVVNALEATPRGGEVSLAAEVRDGLAVLEVRDTGTGIPVEIQADLFKPYVSTKRRGSGIGLALTDKLVSQHGGQVTFDTSSAGTTFRIALPATGEGLDLEPRGEDRP